MSVTVHTKYQGIGKHFKTRFGAALCGIAIAVAALGAILFTSQKGTSVGTGPVVIANSATPAVSAAPFPVTYYLVGTQEEADRLQMLVSQQQYETIMAGLELSPGLTIYLPIDTPEREAMLALMMQDLNATALETGIMMTHVIDLRSP